jgi:predicted PurR-regulated permease PerM
MTTPPPGPGTTDDAPSNPPDASHAPAPTHRPGWKSGDFARGALIALAVWLALQLLWTANALVFVVFLGVLFGVAVASGVDVLERRGVRRGIGSALLVFGTVGVIALAGALLAPTLAAQSGELRRDVPEALDKLRALIDQRAFGFLDPFLRAPNDTATAPDSAQRATDSAVADSIARQRPRPTPPAPKLPELDTSALRAISKSIDDSLRARLPRIQSADSGLFDPAGPFAPSAARTDSASDARVSGVLGDTLENPLGIDVDAKLEARTQFLRDSLRTAMRENIAAAERRAREELLASGVVAARVEPTRSEMLARRLSSGLAGSSRQLFSLVTGTIAAIGGLIMVMFLAIYIGAEPGVYRRWVMAVLPAEHRSSVASMLEEMGTVLRKWLVTQLVAMVVIGVVSTVALLLLDVRAAFALGLIAGLLEFVPTIGPVLSAIPAVAMAFVDSPQKALFVLIAYWAIQFVENNLLIPALMRDEMDLPPALTLIAQALMGVLFGFLGLMVAVPLTAAVLVPIRQFARRQDARERELLDVVLTPP